MTCNQDVDTESRWTIADAERVVGACLTRVSTAQEAVEASAALVTEATERLVLDGVGLLDDLTLFARNSRRTKAQLKYAEGALDQALQEYRATVAAAAPADPEEAPGCRHNLGVTLDGECIAGCGAVAR